MTLPKAIPSSLLLLACSGPAAAGHMLCFEKVEVVSVYSGYVDMHYGADGGDAVTFTMSDGSRHALKYSYNLDWARGKILHATLVRAMGTGLKLSGYGDVITGDPAGGMCAIDEIVMHR
jgi:hypothetical protein